MTALPALFMLTVLAADPLGPGDHNRKLTVDDRERTYLVHVPKGYDSNKPTPVVLILHGAGTNAVITVAFTGMSKKSDEAGFVAVPFAGPNNGTPKFLTFKSVEETVRIWCKINDCPQEPQVTDVPDKEDDGTKVRTKTYGPAKDGAEVVLIEIEGGGHTWPGQKAPISFLGRSTLDISANDLMWDFFQKHPMK